MITTIDSAGRLVIPKAVRDAAGIRHGVEVEVRFRDGCIEIEPAPRPMRLIEREGGGVLIEAEGEMPVLTADDVRAAVDQTRR